MRDVFEKLISFSEESHRQFSDIIECYGSNLSKGIDELIEEVSDLRAELSLVRQEKTVLIETVGNLNGEIRQLSGKLQSVNHSSDADHLSVNEGYDGAAADESYDMREVQDLTHDIAHDMDVFAVEQEQSYKAVEDKDLKDSISISQFHTQLSDKPDINEEGKCDSAYSEHLVCPECKLELSTKENQRIHIQNFHSKSNETNAYPGQDNRGEKSAVSIDRNFKIEEPKFECHLCPFTSNAKKMLSSALNNTLH